MRNGRQQQLRSAGTVGVGHIEAPGSVDGRAEVYTAPVARPYGRPRSGLLDDAGGNATREVERPDIMQAVLPPFAEQARTVRRELYVFPRPAAVGQEFGELASR